jgi:hypothetical protein
MHSKEEFAMKKSIIFALTVAMALAGTCSTTALAQDLDQASQKIFDDQRAIAQAAGAYFTKNGSYPANVAALVADGQLVEVPTPDCTVLACTTARYEISDWGDSDGNGTSDIVVDIVDGGNAAVDLCLNFNSKHTSLGSKVFKHAALGGGSRSPWPENDKSLCVCWKDGCDQEPAGLQLGDINIITIVAH